MADHFISLTNPDWVVTARTSTAQAIVRLIEKLCPERVAEISLWNAGNPWIIPQQQARELARALKAADVAGWEADDIVILRRVETMLSRGGVEYQD